MAVIPWFKGTFDGNGYVISNLHIQGGGHLGLFGKLDSGGKISNLGLEAVEVNGRSLEFNTGHRGSIVFTRTLDLTEGDLLRLVWNE